MDEPLGALDKKLREALQLEIMRISRQLGATVIYVTHDQEEALVMSDRIAIFDQGRIQQLGSGEDLYERPTSVFVADFVGESNILRGRLERDGTATWLPRGVALARGSGGRRAPGCRRGRTCRARGPAGAPARRRARTPTRRAGTGSRRR